MQSSTAFTLGVGIAMAGLVPGAWGQTKVSGLTCSAFLDARSAAQEAPFSAYLEGYVTALHQGLAVTQDSANVRDWCARNPKQMYSEAVSHVVGAFERRTAADRLSRFRGKRLQWRGVIPVLHAWSPVL